MKKLHSRHFIITNMLLLEQEFQRYLLNTLLKVLALRLIISCCLNNLFMKLMKGVVGCEYNVI